MSAGAQSNDGGFRSARTLPLAATVSWRLKSSGSERLPKTIYVCFGATQTLQDDIVLDQTRPRLLVATVSRAKPARAEAATASRWLIKLKASDRTSGVGKVQFATRRPIHRGPCATARA